jgi:hypothetical protein
VTVEPPVLVTVSDSAWLVPVFTVPKLRLVGFAASAPTPTPVPVSEKEAGLLVALLVTETVALKVPAAFGEKTKLTGILCPASIAAGKVGALNEKY